MAEKQYMAIDQFGQAHHGLTHPRKDLLELFNRQHADKMYTTGKDGTEYHVGYVIAGCWLRVYEVVPMRKPA